MRVIAGKKRGQKLVEFSAENIRPTPDRVKEALFSMIEPHLSDAVVLDLFSGTAALAIESLSRGAKEAVCVDASKQSLDVIKKNLSLTEFNISAKVFLSEAVEFLNKQSPSQFDIIFLDPPYSKNIEDNVLKKIDSMDLLKPDGIIILETEYAHVPDDFKNLHISKQRKYGRTYITIYIKNDIEISLNERCVDK